jgi:hypothetical protein
MEDRHDVWALEFCDNGMIELPGFDMRGWRLRSFSRHDEIYAMYKDIPFSTT